MVLPLFESINRGCILSFASKNQKRKIQIALVLVIKRNQPLYERLRLVISIPKSTKIENGELNLLTRLAIGNPPKSRIGNLDLFQIYLDWD